jgi:hypothetical protein
MERPRITLLCKHAYNIPDFVIVWVWFHAATHAFVMEEFHGEQDCATLA